jgi:phosphohistidine swiveling domain-containing protein
VTSVPPARLAGEQVLAPDAAGRATAEEIGAKAASLVALQALDLPVPPFVAVGTAAFDTLFARLPAELREALVRLPAANEELVELSERALREFRELGLDGGDAERLDELFEANFGPSAFVSVRSSAVGEDSASHSFAGQFDTYLYVTRETLADRVVDCFASAFSPRALLYRRLHGLGLEAGRMAVLVQLMIDSRAAGVAFTADPTTGRADRLVIAAGLGLGKGVVDGEVSVDTFIFDADANLMERAIEEKSSRVVFDRRSGVGTVVEEVSAEDAARPALGDHEAARIASMALTVARSRGVPQDVEWAIATTGEAYLLQSRPITTPVEEPKTGVEESTTPVGERELIFDNSNLVESYPGLTSPLTYSFMKRSYERMFLEVVRTFGVSEPMIERDRDIYDTLVALLDGRMYYNLTSWYRMFLQVPGMERALPAFEKALGFEERSDLELEAPTLRSRLRALPLQARVVGRLLRTLRSLGKRANEFEATFNALASEVRAAGVERLGPHELLDRIDRYRRLLFRKMAAAPMNDFYAMQLYALLGALIDKWGLGDQVSTRNELLCGEQGMESVEPVRSVVRLAELVRGDPRARALFDSPASEPEVWAAIQGEPGLERLRDELQRHVERYGDRTMNELKLETLTLLDDPSPLVAMLRNLLRGGQSVESMESRERAIRAAAEKAVKQRLAGRPLRRVLFAVVLRRCRWCMKTRERLRLTRGRMAGMFRALFRALGERLAAHGVLEARDDIFFLTFDEVCDVVRGGSATRDIRALVAQRQREYTSEGGRATPSRIKTRGVVLGLSLGEGDGVAAADGQLVGTGCSPGRVRAPAKVVLAPTPYMKIDGEILVASTTDPGWVFLMIAAGGLVSEKGSVLSHTAIIGRELGIPTVVGVKDATRLLPDGKMLELDGRAGTVTVADHG